MTDSINQHKRLKVLLTQPLFSAKYLLGNFKPGSNANTFLYGQACLAAVAREGGHEVLVLDPYKSKITPEFYVNFLREHQFDVIGCTIYTLTFNLAKNLFEYSRSTLPYAYLIAGGPHPTSLPKETLEQIPQLDFVVYKEGEVTFLELLESIKFDKDFSSIEGIVYRRKEDNQIVLNPPRKFISDLDKLPMPAYDLFPMKDYVPTPNLVRHYPTIALQVTRGCPYKCAFCQFNLSLGKKYRHRSVEKIIEELIYLKYRYKARGIIFRDSVLTVNIPFLKKLCKAMIDNKIDLKWMCYSRTDIMAKHYKELLPLMKRAGCWQIGYGCESANQKSLDILKKGTTVENNIVSVIETMNAGLMCSTTWMLCLPRETPDDTWRTVFLANKLASHVAKFFLPLPFPNTDLEEICREDGGLREGVSYEEYDLIMPKTPIYINPLIGAGKMTKILKAAYRKYYTNHKVLFKNFVTITDRDTIKKYWAFLRMIH